MLIFSKKIFFSNNFCVGVKENEASFEILENILFVKMEISKLNTYIVET
jgi:hypothetical protein